MNILCGDIRIRDFNRKDADNLYQIVREKSIAKYMADCSTELVTDTNRYAHIDKMQALIGGSDFVESGKYPTFAVALRPPMK